MTLPVDHFEFDGWVAGDISREGTHLAILATEEDGLTGLSSPDRTTTMSDHQGHGRVPGSQWANERTITATVWCKELDTVLRFDNAMAPRPDPLDEIPWVGNFLGLGQRRMYVRPQSCTWKLSRNAVFGVMWRIDCSWVASDPTIFSDVLHEEAYGGTGDGGPLAYKDIVFTNEGLSRSLSPRAWTWRLTAHGTVHDPYITNLDDTDQSIRFTGLTMTSGQVLEVDVDRTCLVGARHVEGLIRSRGQKFPYWPTQQPGENTWRIGAISGTVSGLLRHRDTWSI